MDLQSDGVCDSIKDKVVLDTNVFVSAIMSRENICRSVLRMAFDGKIRPLMGNALFLEYESLMARDHIFKNGPFDREKRMMFLEDFLSTCQWVDSWYLWRPNLPDEGDNHIVELAVSGGAQAVITQNEKDFLRGELDMPGLDIIHPQTFLTEHLEHKRRQQWFQH